jgi:hypothetical protein
MSHKDSVGVESLPLRAFVETSAVNWLADWPDEAGRFFQFVEAGRLVPVVTREVSFETRRTSDHRRREQLERVLRQFFPLAPTYLPRMGAFRLGMGMMTNGQPSQTYVDLGFLAHPLDRTHLVNAACYRCDVFLTRDAEMLKEKVQNIEALLGVTRVLHPRSLLEEMIAARITRSVAVS